MKALNLLLLLLPSLATTAMRTKPPSTPSQFFSGLFLFHINGLFFPKIFYMELKKKNCLLLNVVKRLCHPQNIMDSVL